MPLRPTNTPLTAKEFNIAVCGLCGACGCSCGYILYLKDNEIVDIYGHPADPNGIGSLCTKGITYIRLTDKNPLRLRSFYLKTKEGFEKISKEEAISVAKERIKGKRVAFLLDRSAGIEEYVLATKLSELVFTDTTYLPFKASTLKPTSWKDSMLIISLEAEPVFSEVMATRWIIDALEKGAYLYTFSSRYGTLSAKATKSYLLPPHRAFEILEESREIKRLLSLIKRSLILVGSSLLNSPFKERTLRLIKELRNKFRVDYSIVGDLMPFPAKGIEELPKSIDEFDVLIVFGNALKFLKDEELKALKEKFVMHFALFPNFTAHNADLLIPVKHFTERDFINYRHGFGYVSYSPKALERKEFIHPYEFLSYLFNTEINLESFLENYGISLEKLKEEGLLELNLPPIESFEFKEENTKEAIYIHTDNGLVEDLGHWHAWTHGIERYQYAYLNENTAKKLKVKDSLRLGDLEFKVFITPNVADGVIFIPSSYDEYQPFDPGISVGRFLKRPYDRFEALE